MKIIISKGWSLSGPTVLEKREVGGDLFNDAAAVEADALLARHAEAQMAHVLTSSGGHWYKSRHDLGRTYERNGRVFSAGWTFNTNEGD